MNLDDVRAIYKNSTFPKLVSVKYNTSRGDTRTAYYFLMDIFDMPLDKMPPKYRKEYGSGKKKPIPPYVVFGAFLNKEGLPLGRVYRRLEDILEMKPVRIR